MVLSSDPWMFHAKRGGISRSGAADGLLSVTQLSDNVTTVVSRATGKGFGQGTRC